MRNCSGLGFSFGLDFLLNAGGVDDDGRLPIDGTFVFTDATTGTLLFFYNGSLLLIPHDGMVGALFVTDQADFILIVGEAARLVDMGHTHLD